MAYRSVLDGQHARLVVTITGSGSTSPTIDGFTITRGDATGAVTDCTGSSNGPSGCGGGVFVREAGPTISNNAISNDGAASAAGTNTCAYGGGIHAVYPNGLVIRRNEIIGNTAGTADRGLGGGNRAALFAHDGGPQPGDSLTVTNNIIARGEGLTMRVNGWVTAPLDITLMHNTIIGTGASPVASGYVQVTNATTYSASRGFGWPSGTIAGRDRGTADDLQRDLNFTADGTLVAAVLPGRYQVTVRMGDATAAHDQMGVYLEGSGVNTPSTGAGAHSTTTYTIAVPDGQLTVRLVDQGGSDLNVVMNGLEIR